MIHYFITPHKWSVVCSICTRAVSILAGITVRCADHWQRSAGIHESIYNGYAVMLLRGRNVSVLFILFWIFNKPFRGLRAPACKVLKYVNVSVSSCTFSKLYWDPEDAAAGDSHGLSPWFQNDSCWSVCALCLWRILLMFFFFLMQEFISAF